MSIFKDTLSQYVQDQLKAREIIISQGTVSPGPFNIPINNVSPDGNVPRSSVFTSYVAGKNSWVRMASFVNVDKKIGGTTYVGDQLARKYILEGGTLFEDSSQRFSLREGIATRGGVYGSNIDLGPTKDNFRPLGIRPMPGITSVQVNNKSAYGSLREATIKFYAWDKHQLEELELLYMRTGYSVLLEWGWSQYLQSGKTIKGSNNKDVYVNTLDNITTQNFDYPTIDIFYDNDIINPPDYRNSDEIIYGKIEGLTKKANGNYDAMLGHIKNFSWQIMPNGGFECTTVLISRGEVISTLKLNSNNSSLVLNDAVDPNIQTPPLSQFETIFLNYTAIINNSELTSKWRNGNQIGQFATGSSFITDASKIKFQQDLINKLGPAPSQNRVPLLADDGSLFNQQMVNDLSSHYGITLLTAGGEDGVGIEYIKMDHLIALINLYYNYKDKGNRVISSILIPKNNLCLASTDSVSIDATTCLIFNDQAKEVTADQPDGFTPKVFISVTSDPSQPKDVVTSPLNNPPQFLAGKGRGKINNIYVSIPKILSIYRETARNGDVNVIELLKKLLNQISVALGNINDFSLHTTKSSAQIIDVKYLEQGNNTKYEFDLLGLKSICRDVKITSRIFESQASMIAIAAQSKENVGDLYTSTQVYFNSGLTDRILPEKDVYNDANNAKKDDFYLSIYKSAITLANYLKVKVIGSTINIGGGTSDRTGIIYPAPPEITNSASLLKSFHYQLRGDETSFKAIIPVELEITLDGIAGLVQGQIFKVNSNILPSAYNQNNVGFIITGLNHSLQNNDWITVVKAQICLLDNDNIKFQAANFKKYRKILQKLIQQGKKNQYLILAIADYISLVTLKMFDRFYLTSGLDRTTSPNYLSNKSQADKQLDFFVKKDKYRFALSLPNSYPSVGGLSSLNFEEFLKFWHQNIQIANSSTLGDANKRKTANFPETLSDFKTITDPARGTSEIFKSIAVDNLVFNKTKSDATGATYPLVKNFIPLSYSYFGRNASNPENINGTSVTKVIEDNEAFLCVPDAFPELLRVMEAIYNVFHQNITPDNAQYYTINNYKSDLQILKKYNLVTVDNAGGKVKLDPKKFYDYILDNLVNNIFNKTKNPSLPDLYTTITADLTTSRSYVTQMTGNPLVTQIGLNMEVSLPSSGGPF